MEVQNVACRFMLHVTRDRCLWWSGKNTTNYNFVLGAIFPTVISSFRVFSIVKQKCGLYEWMDGFVLHTSKKEHANEIDCEYMVLQSLHLFHKETPERESIY